MSRNTSIVLSDRFAGFLDDRIKAGRFGSVSDAIRAGLRLLEEEEAKFDTLRAALIEGANSGPSVAVDVEAILAEAHERVRRAA